MMIDSGTNSAVLLPSIPGKIICGPATLALILLCCFGWPGGQSFAGQIDPGVNVETIDEIQVTATRRPASSNDVSAALTVIGSEEIRGVKILTDALAAQPGVFLQQTTPGQGAAIVRGLKGSEVLHIVDGFRLNNAIFRNAPTQYLSLVAPGGVERIEILRGAPASLYGSDAVGGVLQVVSRMPQFQEHGYRGDLHVATDTADLARIIRGSFEAGNAKLAGFVSGEYLQTGNRSIGGGERVGPSDYESSGARVAVQATPNEQESWSVDLQYARQPATPRYDELVPGYGQTEPSSSEFLFSPNERLFALLRHRRDAWLWSADWNFSLGWQKIVDDRITRNYEAPERQFEQNSSDLFGLTASALKEFEASSLIVGAELYQDHVRSSRSETNVNTGSMEVLLPRFPDGSTVDQAALYGNLQYDFTDRQSVTGGLRITSVNVDIPASGIVPAASVDQTDVSADFGWLFEWTSELQFVANVGYGFRAPNVFDLGTLGERPGNRFNVPNPDLQSERVTQVDLGLRRRSERWDLDVMVYAMHYTDRITSVLTGDVTATGRDVVQSQNVASAEIYGVEAAANFLLSPDWTANLVVNLQRGEQEGETGVTEPADRMPPFNGRFGLRYQATNALQIEPYVVFADRQDRLSPRDVRDNRINPDGTPGWLTLNVAATWQVADKLQFSAAVLNLTDQRYRVHGSGIDATGINLSLSADWMWN